MVTLKFFHIKNTYEKLCRTIVTVLFFLLILITPNLKAEQKTFSLFVGAGVGYSWPEVYRFQWKNVEFGEYPGSIGATQVYQQGNYYLDFGAGLSRQGPVDLGVIGSVGWHKTWGFVGLKVDWSTFAAFNSYMTNEVTLGLTLDF